MKIKTKLFVFILLTNSMRHGTSTAHFKCLSGYKATLDNEVMSGEFSEVTCHDDDDACFSARGSFVLDGSTWEVIEVRGCYDKLACGEIPYDIKSGEYTKYTLKRFLKSSGVAVDIQTAGEAGGTTPNELKCCEESLCDITVVEPVEEVTTEAVESNSENVVKNNFIIIVACFAVAYIIFI